MADRDRQSPLDALLETGEEAARTRQTVVVRAVVDAVERIAAEDVADAEIRSRLRHGCAAVDRLAADEPLVAAEYFRAMRTLLEESW